MANPTLLSLTFFAIVLLIEGVSSTTFTFTNDCNYTVWPGAISGSSSPPLPSTGFELQQGASQSLQAPSQWSGRMWTRYRCSNDSSGNFSCESGDCGTGQVACGSSGGAPPATLVEFTLQGSGGQDFYDISNVDGFNVPVSITQQGGGPPGNCTSPACAANIDADCPQELQYTSPSDGAVIGCESACLAFNTDQYCCRGAYGNSSTCLPTNYSQFFKTECPQAYSYAYDDSSSTFTCTGANYVITYCP